MVFHLSINKLMVFQPVQNQTHLHYTIVFNRLWVVLDVCELLFPSAGFMVQFFHAKMLQYGTRTPEGTGKKQYRINWKTQPSYFQQKMLFCF